MSDIPGPAARRALPPRDDEPDAPRPRRLAAAGDDAVAGPGGQEPGPRRSPAGPTDPPVADPAPASARDARTPTRRLGVVTGVVAAVALLVVVVLWVTSGGGNPLAVSTPTPTLDRATLLAEPADLAGLRTGTTWTASATLDKIVADSPQPKCIALATDTEPRARASWVRTLAAEGGDPAAALHEVDHYATAEDATAAWEQRVTQLGACSRSTVWLTRTVTVEGTSDQAVGATLVVQETQPEYHTILVSRTGSDVNLVDLTSAAQAWPLEAAATTLATLGTRQCAATSGTCPTTPKVTDRTPPPTQPAGWLASVDLPRLTPGAGTWRGTDVATLKLPGAACEAVDLANVPGATARQRTYLVHDDPRSSGIGIDEAVFSFATPAEAADLVARITTNVDGCAGRTATATVGRTGELASATASGPSWAITQKVTGEKTARFRVSVVASGSRALYVFANPTATVDFSDGDWQAIVNRAAARLGQLP